MVVGYRGQTGLGYMLSGYGAEGLSKVEAVALIEEEVAFLYTVYGIA